MGVGRSATMKIQRYTRRKPRLSVRDFSPYVAIEDWLTAWRVSLLGVRRSWAVDGQTLTSAPVSIRNLEPLTRSVK